MSPRSITLDDLHFRAAQERADLLGTTPDEFVSRLIDAEQVLDELSFDQILAPVRDGFDAVNDQDLDNLLREARSRISLPPGQ